MADCTARAISGVSCAMTSDTRRAASSELLVVVVAGPTLLREPWLNPAEVWVRRAALSGHSLPCSVYIPSTLLLSTPKPSCPDDKEDVESNLFPEAEDSEEKLCWLETEAVEAVEADEAPTAAWTAWATWGWMASRICCTRLPLAREAWEEREESWEAVRDEEEEEEEEEEELEEELEEEEETDNSLVAFST